jgi:hypothetical protein
MQEIAVYKNQACKLERKLAKLDRRADEKVFLQEVLDKVIEGEHTELQDIIQEFISTKFLSRFSSETVSEISYPDE